MKVLFAAVLALALPAAVDGLGAGRPLMEDEKKIGAGVTLTEGTPIDTLIKTPQNYVGKKVRIDGVATAVCASMGCWMAVAESDKADAPTVRLKVEHEGAIVFPMSAKGKRVSAEGIFEAIAAGDAHGKEAAAEHAKHDAQATHHPEMRHDKKHDGNHGAKASAEYHIKATGAIVR